VLGSPCALSPHQFGSDRSVGGDGTHAASDLGRADLVGGIHAVDEHTSVVDFKSSRTRIGRYRIGILERNTSPKSSERHGAVHRSGIEVLETEPSSECPGNGALASAGRTIDGDDAQFWTRHRHQLVPSGMPSL
jgi:hypothetical protein